MKELYSVNQVWYQGNNHYTFNIHTYSEILDITISDGTLYLHYLANNYVFDKKDVFVQLVSIYEDMTSIMFNQRYLGKISLVSEDDFNVISNGNSFTITNNKLSGGVYLVFIDENKQIDEMRDEKIDEILEEND